MDQHDVGGQASNKLSNQFADLVPFALFLTAIMTQSNAGTSPLGDFLARKIRSFDSGSGVKRQERKGLLPLIGLFLFTEVIELPLDQKKHWKGLSTTRFDDQRLQISRISSFRGQLAQI